MVTIEQIRNQVSEYGAVQFVQLSGSGKYINIADTNVMIDKIKHKINSKQRFKKFYQDQNNLDEVERLEEECDVLFQDLCSLKEAI